MYLSTYRSKVLDLQNDWGTPPRRAAESPDLEAVSLYLSRLAGAGHTFAAGRNRIRPLGGGFNNSIYEVDTATGIYIIKVYPADRAQRLERESAAMERLSFLDAVPRPLSADPWTAEMKAPVLIYEKLPGSPVESARMTREDLNLLMETLVEVHDLKVPPDSPLARPSGPARPMDCLGYIDKTMRDMAKSAALNDPPFRQTLDRLHDLRRCLSMMDLKPALWAESHPCLCHGDFRPANVLRMGPDRIGLVDWEHAGVMDPLFEIAGFFWHPESAAVATDIRDVALTGYCERSNDPHAFEKMAVYQVIFPIQWSVRILSLIEGYDRQKVQPWNKPWPLEALWEDMAQYLGLAAALPGRV